MPHSWGSGVGDGLWHSRTALHGYLRHAHTCRHAFPFSAGDFVGCALAVTFSYSALRLAFRFRDANKARWRGIGSAFVMGAAISATHYTGMTAATFTGSAVQPDFSHSVSVSSLGTTGIIIVTLLVLSRAILSSFVDRPFHVQALQLALAEAKIEFADVARVARLGELAASIAHEINQHLGAVVNSGAASLRWQAMQCRFVIDLIEGSALLANPHRGRFPTYEENRRFAYIRSS
jgi:hypothetical protein